MFMERSRPSSNVRRATIGFAWVILFAFGLSMAQGPPQSAELALEVSSAMKQNAMEKKHYSWKRRVELQVKGETKAVKMHLVRFDIDGKPQSTPIAGDDAKQKRGLRGRIQKKKQKKTKEWFEDVAEIVVSYTYPSPGTLVDTFGKAIFVKGSGQMQGTLKIRAKSAIRPGDTYTLWVDPESKAPRMLEFKTELDKDTLIGTVYYRELNSGLIYPGRTIVRVPEDDRRVVIETFDYSDQR